MVVPEANGASYKATIVGVPTPSAEEARPAGAAAPAPNMSLWPLTLSVTDKETVNAPIWAGVGAIVIGGLLLVFGSKKG